MSQRLFCFYSKFYLRIFLNLLVFLFLEVINLNLALANDTSSRALGNRVIVFINNIPYTQLQIERYLNTKETLRDSPQNSAVVGQGNWTEAVEAFVNDMVLHQEATKSSGFRPTKETILKLRYKIEGALQLAPQFKRAFNDLGMSKTNIETEALKIATIENFRRSKANQGAVTKAQGNQPSNGEFAARQEETSVQSPNFETEIRGRAIVRYFQDAKTWKEIHPLP